LSIELIFFTFWWYDSSFRDWVVDFNVIQS
jgi:hypothetical protein